jgi:hypothetical protein
MVLSEYVPVAVNCCVLSTKIDGDCGVTAIETSVGAVTVRVAVPLTEPEVAVIVAVPPPTPDARPWLPAVLLMVAMLVLDDFHATEVVRVCMVPSEYVPVAVNC